MGLLNIQMKRQWSERPPSVLQASAAACLTFTPGTFPKAPVQTPPPLKQGLSLPPLSPQNCPRASPSLTPRRVFPRSPPLLTHSLWLPSALETKPDPFYPGIQGSTHSVPTSPPRQKLKPCQSPPNFQEASLHFTPSPWLCRSHPAVWNALPPPWPRKGSREGSGVGSEAVSWWGGGGLSQVLLPLAPSLPSLALPWGRVASRSLAGSAPPPHPWLQPDQDSPAPGQP